MPWGKPRSIKLADFGDAELEHLVAAYDEIAANLAGLGGLCAVRLSGGARTRDERLAELRRLEAAGELWIRVSYAGNLNVLARESGALSDEREPGDDGVGYIRLIRRRVMTR